MTSRGDVKYVTPGGFYRVEKVRWGYEVFHVGTGLVVPHMHSLRMPERVTGHTTIRYLADAKAFARRLESMPGMDTHERPRRGALLALEGLLKSEAIL